jgi:hypothetical protein
MGPIYKHPVQLGNTVYSMHACVYVCACVCIYSPQEWGNRCSLELWIWPSQPYSTSHSFEMPDVRTPSPDLQTYTHRYIYIDTNTQTLIITNIYIDRYKHIY